MPPAAPGAGDAAPTGGAGCRSAGAARPAAFLLPLDGFLPPLGGAAVAVAAGAGVAGFAVTFGATFGTGGAFAADFDVGLALVVPLPVGSAFTAGPAFAAGDTFTAGLPFAGLTAGFTAGRALAAGLAAGFGVGPAGLAAGFTTALAATFGAALGAAFGPGRPLVCGLPVALTLVPLLTLTLAARPGAGFVGATGLAFACGLAATLAAGLFPPSTAFGVVATDLALGFGVDFFALVTALVGLTTGFTADFRAATLATGFAADPGAVVLARDVPFAVALAGGVDDLSRSAAGFAVPPLAGPDCAGGLARAATDCARPPALAGGFDVPGGGRRVTRPPPEPATSLTGTFPVGLAFRIALPPRSSAAPASPAPAAATAPSSPAGYGDLLASR